MLPLFWLMSCTAESGLEVQDVWARDTLGRTANAAVFMTIESGVADRLIAASTPVAKKADLMTFAGGTGAMRMSYVDAIEISADEAVSLDPTGLHVWLADLNEPLQQGQAFPLSLRFKDAGERRVMVRVIGPSAAPPGSYVQTGR